MPTDLTRTQVFLSWSQRGDLKARKIAWSHATRRWDAERIGTPFAWVVPSAVTWETLEEVLVKSDKAIVTFPRRGKALRKAASCVRA